tara:strand:+ start:1394 stop:1627 length:234 start_codon:yes stop_codon:yes gene_type:complete
MKIEKIKMNIPPIIDAEGFNFQIDFKDMIKFLEQELKYLSYHYQDADAAWLDSYLRLEKFLEMRGPFHVHEGKIKKS